MVDFKVDIKRDYRGVLQRPYFLDKSDGLRMGRYSQVIWVRNGQGWFQLKSFKVHLSLTQMRVKLVII